MKIKISNSYQEDGYVNLEYTLSGVTISGNDVQTVYSLEYRKDDKSDWADADEEFDI